MKRLADLSFSDNTPAPTGVIVRVDDTKRYQQFEGLGGTMTDSTAWEISRLPTATRTALMEAMFGSDGDHLSFLRLPIGASDFTAKERPYSYDNMPPGQSDPQLTHFSIRHDQLYIIPVLKQALAINPDIQVIASPWSAPDWMKTNDALNNIHGLGFLKPTDYPAYAEYFVKFIEAYQRSGIHIDAVTPQNEPGTHTISPGMNFPVNQEALFIDRFLRPALRQAGLETKIYGYDASWSSYGYASSLARQTTGIDGIAWHCYAGRPWIMTALHRTFPRLDQKLDECAENLAFFPEAMVAIAAFRNWATGAAVWALVLDTNGGPVQPPNSHCPSCYGAVEENNQTRQLTYERKFFELGQFSHFVSLGAQRIYSPSDVRFNMPRGTHPFTAGLADVAFRNPDGTDVLIAYNNSDAPISFSVDAPNRGWFGFQIPAQATTTFAWR
jgi:glucosylceramidase